MGNVKVTSSAQSSQTATRRHHSGRFKKEEADLLKAEIYKSVDAPIEIHVTTPDRFKRRHPRLVEKLEEA